MACTQACNQGRACACRPQPAEAATDIGADDQAAADTFLRVFFICFLGCALAVALLIGTFLALAWIKHAIAALAH